MTTTDDGPIDLTGFNPFDPAVQQCPHGYYAAMREQTPVFHVPGTDIYLVTRHDLITPILRDVATFSNQFGNTGEPAGGEVIDRLREVMAKGWLQVPTMLTIDPPKHTRYRGTVAPFFTPKRVNELRVPIEAICTGLVDGFVDEGAIDLVPRFAIPLPIEAIALVLNVPIDRMADFKRWSDDSIAAIGAQITDDERVRAQEGIVEFQHFFADQLERRRVEPQPDLLTDLVEASIATDDGEARPLDMAEMLSIVQQLLVAGNETTTKAITEGVRLLSENPDRWAWLQADPAAHAVALTEEVLRLATPTQGMFRVVTRDTVIDGVPVPKGARLVVVYSAANRDPSVFDAPDEFDPQRANLKDHLAFGKGIHFCLGAPLSRLEMQVAFETLARRFETITVVPGAELAYHPSFLLRGLKRLDVQLTPARLSPVGRGAGE